MYCWNCGEEVAGPSGFCSNCGARLIDAAARGSDAQDALRGPTGASALTPAAAPVRGMDVKAVGLTFEVRNKPLGKKQVLTNNVSFHIEPGQVVAIIGKSGSGKSTLLKELAGFNYRHKGKVYFDGVDFYEHYYDLIGSFGYVPQDNYLHEGLTLGKMLLYEGREKANGRKTDEEIKESIDGILKSLKFSEQDKKKKVKNLSGGEKKRAAIAVDMLNQPRLRFLDEPTSSLDEDVSAELMKMLRESARQYGCTTILVTHKAGDLGYCDKVICLQPGGTLRYFGSPAGMKEVFGTDDLEEVQRQLEQPTDEYNQTHHWKPEAVAAPAHPSEPTPDMLSRSTVDVSRQRKDMTALYSSVMRADKGRLALLLLQAPLLSAITAFTAGKDCFVTYEATQSTLFMLACTCFWIGIFDSVQEICKERMHYKLECARGLDLRAYYGSKLAVLGVLNLVQSLLFTAGFLATIGADRAPGGLFNAPAEFFVTTFLTMLSATTIGLLFSAVLKSTGRAMAAMPLLVVPQILFSGIIFRLGERLEIVYTIISCHWAIVAYGTTSKVSALEHAIVRQASQTAGGANTATQLRQVVSQGAVDWYDPTLANLLVKGWLPLLLISVACVAGAYIALSRDAKNRM